MEFIKHHFSTIFLITIAAFWIGISLGTKDCPSCVVVNMAESAFGANEDQTARKPELPSVKEANWTAVDIQGNLISSTDLEGKVGVFVYWATWCGGCKKEIPDLVALREEFSPDEVEIIGLSVDEKHKDLKAYAEAVGINYRIARVTPSVVEAFGQAEAIPTLLIVDQEGRIQFRHTGIVNKDTLSERVRSLLATRRIDREFGS
ncbi:antioxidant, AhpC/TSA family [Verrucomicrobiia bacterium DG1235]|nr:antioxidant, AhpC/TSA family [Verrucomicrobiae bacterium DG1235]